MTTKKLQAVTRREKRKHPNLFSCSSSRWLAQLASDPPSCAGYEKSGNAGGRGGGKKITIERVSLQHSNTPTPLNSNSVTLTTLSLSCCFLFLFLRTERGGVYISCDFRTHPATLFLNPGKSSRNCFAASMFAGEYSRDTLPG
jgi:hypothetical protein